jgi:uncharacterized protein YebE (UPF0316 family)
MDVIRPLVIAGLVVTEVGLWQWRMVIAHRGNRASAMILGTLGAVLQITAITQVVTNVEDPLSIGAYAAGVGVGVLLGLIAGDRFTPGSVGVTIITTTADVAPRLWSLGWPATVQSGYGEDGPVTMLFVAINRRHESRLQQDVASIAPEAFWSIEELRARPGRTAPVPVSLPVG